MIGVLLSARMQKTAAKLPDEVREKASEALAAVAQAFGDPHRHGGLGLRKLAKHTYEIRVHLQWRILLIHDGETLIAFDVMNHAEVKQWLKGKRK
ncbi:MAG: hypothetical protein H7Y43_01905 [Akkermansiaceae bacterium]|nr:hypothetical protein [Verrucomicrobiales bacterium]